MALQYVLPVTVCAAKPSLGHAAVLASNQSVLRRALALPMLQQDGSPVALFCNWSTPPDTTESHARLVAVRQS